jgi:SAM-dependent methyltransferase
LTTHGPAAHHAGRVLPADYDSDPGRFAANQAATAAFSCRGDVHPAVARRLAEAGCALVLDVGGGNGVLARELAKAGAQTVTADRASYVTDAPRPVLLADAVSLPFRGLSFPGAAALWVLYHLAIPEAALAEIRRCLRPGGLVVVSAPSRYNDPELRQALPHWGQPLSFDAENGPDQVARVFGEVEVETWDEPMVSLPGPDEVALYLRGRGLVDENARVAAQRFKTPLSVTKRGMLAWARK